MMIRNYLLALVVLSGAVAAGCNRCNTCGSPTGPSAATFTGEARFSDNVSAEASCDNGTKASSSASVTIVKTATGATQAEADAKAAQLLADAIKQLKVDLEAKAKVDCGSTPTPPPVVQPQPQPPQPPATDVCPNIPGLQETVPPGMVKDGAGNCVTPPAACTYAVGPSVHIGFAASNGGIVVSTNHDGCPWSSVSNNIPNLTLGNSTGTTNGSIGFNATANAGPVRLFTISFTGVNYSQTITITQDAGPVSSCSYAVQLEAPQLNYDFNGGNNGTVVSATSGCTWTIESSAFWAAITAGASGTGNGSFNFIVAGNNGAARTATLTVRGSNFLKSFTVTETAHP